MIALVAAAATATVLAVVPPYQIESVRLRFTRYEQAGAGYQSAAAPAGQPGSERELVEQPQAEIVARVGERITERLWVPVDVVTAASPDHSQYGIPVNSLPPDAISTASRTNVAASVDTLTTYRWDRSTDVFFRAALHLEEPFESWTYGIGANRSFAEDNTVVGASLNQVVDWFDHFTLAGHRRGRAGRSTTNLNASLTQILSPTTIAALSYGGTLQLGTLGNTWSSVPLTDGTRGDERLPRQRLRHALAARLAQWLPWEGALRMSYRAYFDDWSVQAHTLETHLVQRLTRGLYVRGVYRVHWQSAVRFFTTGADPADPGERTADSDLARFVAQTVGGAASFDVGPSRFARNAHVDVGYERYFRSNGLTVDITTCGLGFTF